MSSVILLKSQSIFEDDALVMFNLKQENLNCFTATVYGCQVLQFELIKHCFFMIEPLF